MEATWHVLYLILRFICALARQVFVTPYGSTEIIRAKMFSGAPQQVSAKCLWSATWSVHFHASVTCETLCSAIRCSICLLRILGTGSLSSFLAGRFPLKWKWNSWAFFENSRLNIMVALSEWLSYEEMTSNIAVNSPESKTTRNTPVSKLCLLIPCHTAHCTPWGTEACFHRRKLEEQVLEFRSGLGGFQEHAKKSDFRLPWWPNG